MRVPSLSHWRFIARALIRHLVHWRWAYGLATVTFVWGAIHYRIALNMSNSLPQSVYWIVVGDKHTVAGDFVAFEWQRGMFYRRDWTFVKQVAGVPGQTITVHQRTVYIDGKPVGYAKPYSSKGNIALEPIEPGVIPAGFIYVAAAHPDSLDSRYKITGLIAASRVVGRAYVIF